MLDDIIRMKARALRDLSSDDILGALGLERRHTPFESAVPTGLAFVAGLAAGAGIALLLAPKSGRELRQDLSSKASELSSKASELSGKLSSGASELIDEAKQHVPGLEARERSVAAPRSS